MQPYQTPPGREKAGPAISHDLKKASSPDAARKNASPPHWQDILARLALCAHPQTGLRDPGRLLR